MYLRVFFFFSVYYYVAFKYIPTENIIITLDSCYRAMVRDQGLNTRKAVKCQVYTYYTNLYQDSPNQSVSSDFRFKNNVLYKKNLQTFLLRQFHLKKGMSKCNRKATLQIYITSHVVCTTRKNTFGQHKIMSNDCVDTFQSVRNSLTYCCMLHEKAKFSNETFQHCIHKNCFPIALGKLK